MSSPMAPFFTDKLYKDLLGATELPMEESVHLSEFSVSDERFIDKDLEKRMQMAQNITSMVLSLRKEREIKSASATSKNNDSCF